MGYGYWTRENFERYSAARGRAVTAAGNLDSRLTEQQLFTQRELHPRLNPRNVIRECCDSEDHPETFPVILALDVTGSMGSASAEVAKKMNEVMTRLYGEIRDVEFLVMGIGDLSYDRAPIQISQFEADIRIAEQLHDYAASLQVNYARCMTRGDTVAAELCRARGISAAMELFFLLKREYPPSYKWTFRALGELDRDGAFSAKIRTLSEEHIRPEAWEAAGYHPNRLNTKDRIVCVSEEIAADIEQMLAEKGLIRVKSRYLETHVNELLTRPIA